jgi:UDPglucose--hexose-1-phosphate uridylyltransferase
VNELRQNLVTKRWVIIASERAKRPYELASQTGYDPCSLPSWDANCPFCPGNEELDLEVARWPESGPWQVRVVRNRYPAVRADGEFLHNDDGVHHALSAVGFHEILVETPRHNTCQALEPVDDFVRVLTMFRQRGLAIAQDDRIEQIIYFKNHGQRAVASLPHPHAQLIALPIIPGDICSRNEQARRHYEETGRCAMCMMLEQELADGIRVIARGRHFTAFVLFAASSPFHIWITPHRHDSHFTNIDQAELEDLAAVFHRVLRKLFVGVKNPDFNYIIRSAPLNQRTNDYLHWYVTIVPRVTRSAGFELGSDIFINPTIPEESAAFLRAVDDKMTG